MRDILNHQADCIEYVLRTHGIDARIEGGKLSPRLAHFGLALPQGVRPAQVAHLLPDLATELGVTACRLAQADGQLFLEVPRPDPIAVRLMPLVQRVAEVVPPSTATLGLDWDGTPLLLRLHSPDVDPVLVSGVRGSGKSSLLRGMALSLSLHNSPDRLRLLLVDAHPGGHAFDGLEDLPHHACPVAHGPVEALASLRWALRMLARRAHQYGDDELFFDEEEGSGKEGTREDGALVVMIHGIDALCDTGNRRLDAEAADACARLISAGNRHGIHLVASTDSADDAHRINTGWQARISGPVSTAEEARLATGLKGSGAQHLLGAGDFLVSLNAELIRFQAGAVSDSEVGKAVSLINAASINYGQPPVEEEAPPFTMSRRPSRPTLEAPTPLRRSWSGE